MKSFLKAYVTVMDRITVVLSWIMRVILAFMICAVFTQVLSRYLHFSAPFLEELARYCNIYLAFLAMPFCLRKDSMVKIDTLQGIAKGVFQQVIIAFSEIISMIACIFFVIAGIKLIRAGINQTSPTMGFTMAYIYSVIPVCCALGVFNRIAYLISKKEEGK